MFYGNYAGTRIQQILKKLHNRFNDGKYKPVNIIPTFGFAFKFFCPFWDRKQYLICILYAICNRFQTKTHS